MKMLAAPSVVARDTSCPAATPRGSSCAPPGGMTFTRRAYPGARGRNIGRLRRHPAELAAGDVEHLAVDVVAARRAEEEHAPGGLLGRARAAQRDQHGGHAAQLL